MRTPGEKDTTNDHTADQTQLEDLWPREHDLPPRWDGLPVQWDDWSDTAGMINLPTAAAPRALRSLRHGGCVPDQHRPDLDRRGERTAAIGRARLRGNRHPVGLITAFRCPACRHDRVLDPDGQQWDLDTDYTEDGSWDNNPNAKPDGRGSH